VWSARRNVAGTWDRLSSFVHVHPGHDGPGGAGVGLSQDTGSSATDKVTKNGALTLSGVEANAGRRVSINGGTTWSSGFTAIEGCELRSWVRQTDRGGQRGAGFRLVHVHSGHHGPAGARCGF